MRLVAFCGYAQAGKDTAAGFLTEFGYQRLAFADILRQSIYNLNPIVELQEPPSLIKHTYTRVQTIVDKIGWDKAKVKYYEIRELLQRMGTEVGRELYGEDFWVNRVMAQMDLDGYYVITDVRFPNEEKAVHSIGGVIYRIERQGLGAVNKHVSDTNVANLRIDGAIRNSGDLDDYRTNVLLTTGVELD